MNSPRWLQAFSHLNRLPELLRCARNFRHPTNLTARYLGLTKQGYPFELQTRDGLRLEINSYHDAATAWVIFCREEYGMPDSAKTILDIGANYGAFSLWASQHAPGARLIALEPFPDCFKRLHQHVEINNLTDRIACWNTALGASSQDRFVSAQASEESGFPSQSRSFVGEAYSGPASIKIPTLSLGDLVKQACAALDCREIDFVKLDIEGIEHTAITIETIEALRCIRHLSMEYHPNGSKLALFKWLEMAGLHCVADLPVSTDSGVARFTREKARLASSSLP